ncbi:MAG: hypothetical protein LBS48_06760 [Treponema sp.]|jgi:hypothetical protein|nr:hypothetical protein [Treponema sp.]
MLSLLQKEKGYNKQLARRRVVIEHINAKINQRMLGNESFDREEAARAHREATIRRMAEYGGTILAVQDTTGVNYNREESRDGPASHESKKIRPIL